MAKKTSESHTIHAFDFLESPPSPFPKGLVALFGGQRFLQLLVTRSIVATGGTEDEFAVTRLEGCPEWADVMDELQAMSLFGSGDKKVIIDNADDFVKKYREKLEKVAAESHWLGSLILIVETWPATTRLYKILDQSRLQIQCDTPEFKRGKGSSIDHAKIQKWIEGYVHQFYGAQIALKATQVLCELTDYNFGQIDSELAKLALYVEPGGMINDDLVRQHVGGWRTRTMWEASDAIVAGKVSEALLLLDRLLRSGEHPLALFGQLSWSLRRYPKAMEIYDRMKAQQANPSVSEALTKGGFRAWGGEVASAEQNLRRLGRGKIEKLGALILKTDLSLKGSHSRDERARLALEKLVTWFGSTGT